MMMAQLTTAMMVILVLVITTTINTTFQPKRILVAAKTLDDYRSKLLSHEEEQGILTEEISGFTSMGLRNWQHRRLQRQSRRIVREEKRRKLQSNNAGDSSTWKFPITHIKGLMKEAEQHNGHSRKDLMSFEHIQEVLKQRHNSFWALLNEYHRTSSSSSSISNHAENDPIPPEDYTVLEEGEFIVWKSPMANDLVFSAYSRDKSIIIERPVDINRVAFVPPEVGAAWTGEGKMGYSEKHVENYGARYEPDYMSKIDKITVVEGNHLFWGIYYQGIFAHMLLDYIAYFSYLKDHLPPDTKILILDSGTDGNVARDMLEQIDPAFVAEKVTFVPCFGADATPLVHDNLETRLKYARLSRNGYLCYDQMVQVRNGDLIMMHPTKFRGQMNYILNARRWIQQQFADADGDGEDRRVVIYHTRSPMDALTLALEADDPMKKAEEMEAAINPDDVGVKHGRVMNFQMDVVLILLLQSAMRRYCALQDNDDMNKLSPELVLFDGSLSLKDSIKLFQSANVVIGPHGGGMANILFLLDGVDLSNAMRMEQANHEEAPQHQIKVLEFTTSPITPDLHHGLLMKTYYQIYNTAPWVDEYHHVLYTPPSSDDGGTYVNIQDYKDALKSIFRRNYEEGSTMQEKTYVF